MSLFLFDHKRSCGICQNLEYRTDDVQLEVHFDDLQTETCAMCPLLEAVITLFWAERFQQGLNFKFTLYRREESLLMGIGLLDRQGGSSEVNELLQLTTSNETHTLGNWPPARTPLWGVTGPLVAACQISIWMTQCMVTCHSDMGYNSLCQPCVVPPLPTRIIEIQGPTHIRLHTTVVEKNERGRYACLSYCWGRTKFIQTNDSNLESFRNNIPWVDLPRAFQDAVNITWRLGLRYLWIDSLCIIQDNLSDWRHEGSKMASIYSQSFITLAATASPDPRRGLFIQPPSRQLRKHIRVLNTSRRSEDLFVASVSPDVLQRAEDWPLFKRAWVFQERYLSPRVVHFTSNELLWECKTLSTCECKIESKTREQRMMHDKKFPATRDWKNSLDDPRFRSIENWHKIVSEYTTLKLSFEADKFPALQGIAKVMQSQRQTRYYAGLWEDSLLHDLFWFHEKGGCKSEEYHAPSWSWASRVGCVRWHTFGPKFFALASVVFIETTPADKDPLGAITSGILVLKGKGLMLHGAKTLGSSPWWDETDGSGFEDDLVILEVLQETSFRSTTKFCLILATASAVEQTYMRIGTIFISENSKARMWEMLEDEGTVRTFTIV